VIARACRSHLRLTFSYTDHGGAVTARSVEPHRIVHTGRRWYLVARDIDRDDWRSFRVDRIAAPEPAGIRFVPRDPPDAASFVATSVTAAPYRFRARVIVHAPAAVIAQLVPPTVGVLEPAGQDGCLLTAGSDSLDALAFHLAMLGADFTVLEPAELIAQLAALAGRLQAAARRSAAPQTD
jgi:predicted DNA-binding transcriptional regulator YafY